MVEDKVSENTFSVKRPFRQLS